MAAGSGTFDQAGVLARQRMAAAGFDTAAGDTWALNELSSAVRAGTGVARLNALTLLGGLASDGVKGISFGAGVSQALPDVSIYKVNVQNWLQDATFWTAMGSFVSDLAYENYGDVRDYAVPVWHIVARRPRHQGGYVTQRQGLARRARRVLGRLLRG